MKEKELKRLSRAELLELLLVQTKETENLREKLERAEAKLAERQLKIQKAGDLANAVLEINDVMKVTQTAAQQYLDNIARMEQETKQQCEQMLSDAREEADKIRKSALKLETPANVLIEEINALLNEKNM